MRKAEIEKGGEWKQGAKEKEPFYAVADMARRLYSGGFRDWDTAFATPESNLRHWHRQIGEMTIKRLKLYERQLSQCRKAVEHRPSHLVEILTEAEGQDLEHRPFFIDAFPFTFVDRGVSKAVERLIRGEVIGNVQFRALEIQFFHLEEGIQFLNRNFGLGLELRTKDGEVELKMPSTTRVISHPDVLNLDAHRLLEKERQN